MLPSNTRGDLSGSGRSRRLSDIAAFGVVSGAVLLTRVLFLPTSTFGNDPDAWRVALAARHIATTGDYVASRFPAYPVHEIGSALVWFGGPSALNGLTAMFSAVAAGLFCLILRDLEIEHSVLGALAFAMTPVVYENSLVTMDYLWSLAFVLAAMYAVLRERAGWAGAALGLAIGARLTAGAMGFPLAWLLWRRVAGRGARRAPIWFVGTATVVALACYVPPLLVYGPPFLRFYDGTVALPLAAYRATLEVWGVVGFFGVAAALGAALWYRRSSRHQHVEWAVWSGVVLYVIAYVRLPLEAGYLIPVVPLVLIGLGLRAPQRVFVATSICLVLSPFLLDLESERFVPESLREPKLTFAVGESRLSVLPRGPLFTAQARLRAETGRLNRLAPTVVAVRPPAVVVTGEPWARMVLSLSLDVRRTLPVDSLGALDPLGRHRSADPLAVMWPPHERLRRWPIYVLPNVPLPSAADSLQNIERLHRLHTLQPR